MGSLKPFCRRQFVFGLLSGRTPAAHHPHHPRLSLRAALQLFMVIIWYQHGLQSITFPCLLLLGALPRSSQNSLGAITVRDLAGEFMSSTGSSWIPARVEGGVKAAASCVIFRGLIKMKPKWLRMVSMNVQSFHRQFEREVSDFLTNFKKCPPTRPLIS